ncbi:MAG TPA: GFA family protein [Steroidobacteraceae bacterium]|jgi:hypothetical protein|nr:GFA family protein [Steroidobacteraceae bacterium]
MEITGGCLCRRVRFRITAEPIAHCGTQLFSASESRPHLIIVRNGALDDTALMKPGATIWTRQAPEWAWIDDSLPQHPGQPPPVA